MVADFKTLTFTLNQAGQEEKIKALRYHAEHGWEVVSESISNDSFDVDNAVKDGICACLLCGPLCAPLGFVGKKQKGKIIVTLSRTEDARAKYEERRRQREQEMIERAANIRRESQYEREKRIKWLADLPKERFLSIDGDYSNSNLFKALYQYITQESPFKPLPDLEKYSRNTRGIILRDKNGAVLAEYSFSYLDKIYPIDIELLID